MIQLVASEIWLARHHGSAVPRILQPFGARQAHSGITKKLTHREKVEKVTMSGMARNNAGDNEGVDPAGERGK